MSGRKSLMSSDGGIEDRAAEAVAGFTSTRSKTPEALFGVPGGPTHMVRASGARVWTADGRELLDWTMALGAVSLGYAHAHVVQAMTRAAEAGSIGPLPPVVEVTAAERLVAGYPGAEQARFFKTGAEAVQAAVRIARVATGRERVVYCGYHGWLDGPTTGDGVPRQAAALWESVPFGDVAALRRAFDRPAAALLLEPFVEREPPAEWLDAADDLTELQGALLIFDEIKTGFRVDRGGAAVRWDMTPDLAVLGKAMANGAPLAAVVGSAERMSYVRQTWVSSTLAAESVALAAHAAVMDVWDQQDVAAHIRAIGTAVLEALPPGPWDVVGIPEMWFLRFHKADLERQFVLGCVERGVLLKRGAYNFPSLAHTEADVALTARVAQQALDALQ